MCDIPRRNLDSTVDFLAMTSRRFRQVRGCSLSLSGYGARGGTAAKAVSGGRALLADLRPSRAAAMEQRMRVDEVACWTSRKRTAVTVSDRPIPAVQQSRR